MLACTPSATSAAEADPAADPDPVDGDQLVAGEPDQRRGDPAQICQRLRLENRRIDSYPASTAENERSATSH